MHAVVPAEQSEHRERPGRFVRVRALQHQHGAVIGEAPNLGGQSCGGRRVQVHGVVGGVPRNDGRLHLQPDGLVDRVAKAAVGLGQILRAVVQIGEMRDANRGDGIHGVTFISVSILSR